MGIKDEAEKRKQIVYIVGGEWSAAEAVRWMERHHDLRVIVCDSEVEAIEKHMGMDYDMAFVDEYPVNPFHEPYSRGKGKKDKPWDNTPNYHGYKGRGK